MKKTILLVSSVFIGMIAFGQTDSSRHLFAPGTLVGKYYGTYDTTTKKEDLSLKTQKVDNIISNNNTKNAKVQSQTITNGAHLKSTVNADPFDYMNTAKAAQIQSSSNNIIQPGMSSNTNVNGNGNLQSTVKPADPFDIGNTEISSGIQSEPDAQTNLSNQALTPNINTNLRSNVQPVVVKKDNTFSPLKLSTKYVPRAERAMEKLGLLLGSSAPEYYTWITNDDGAGAITNTVKLNPGSFSTTNIATAAYQTRPEIAREQLGFFLGSSIPQYDTWQKNDNGAGAVTNTVKSISGSSVGSNSQNTIIPRAERDMHKLNMLLGSSAPQYDTWTKNDDGAGAITTTVKNPSGQINTDNSATRIQTARQKLGLEMGSSTPVSGTYEANKFGAGTTTTSVNK